jgi:MinD-like ATPase involved in chromosome partitioning or flagellar assembly
MLDAGASIVLDFGDAGMPSTYLASAEEVEDVFVALTRHLYRSGVDVVVLEVADGIFQRETAMLLDSPRFARVVDGIVFAAGDAMGSAAGIQWLQGRGLPVVAASGLLTASPLAIREARAAHGLPVLDLDDLSSPGIAEVLQVRDAAEAGQAVAV